MSLESNSHTRIGWRRLLRPRYVIPAAVVGGAFAAWLAFGYFGVHLLFTDTVVDEPAPVAAAPPTTNAAAPPAETAPIGPLAEGQFIDRSHPTTGTALVLLDEVGQRILRLEGFATDNGPDLNVYLSAAPPNAPAGEFDDDAVDLGDLKGNIGDQNYVIPDEVDLERFTTVVIWCVRFSVAFGAAALG